MRRSAAARATSRTVLALLCLALAAVGQADNLLPNASFELPVSGRDWQPDRSVEGAWHGSRALRIDHTVPPTHTWAWWRVVTSRMVHSQAGPHTLSLYARREGTGTARIIAQVHANPFVCGRNLEVLSRTLTVTSNEWQRFDVTGELAQSNGGWYWVELKAGPTPEAAVWIDAVTLQAGTTASPFEPARPVEYALSMGGDWSRIYVEGGPRPPLVVNACSAGDMAPRETVKLTVRDFWMREVAASSVEVDVPKGSTAAVSVPLNIELKGPFRAELADAEGRLLDELVFCVVPKIDHPVLAHQYGYTSEKMRHLYHALGFAYGGSVATSWPSIQPNGPDEWVWDRWDESYRAFKDNFRQVAQIWLVGAPKWAYDKPDKTTPFPPSAPAEQQFDLEDFLEYAETLARRYPDWRHLQVWNEPWGWKPADYILMLRRCRERLKAVDPDIRILAPTCHPRLIGWTEEFIKLGGLQFTDVFAVHAYPAGGGASLEALAILKKWAWADGNTSRPIWNTEVALHPYHIMTWYTMFMPSNTGSWADGRPVPECNAAEEATERWAKMYLMQKAMGVSRFFSHVGPGMTSFLPRFTHMHHAEPDGGRQPVAAAWAVAGDRIGSATGLGEVAVSPYLTALAFSDGATSKIALWLKGTKRESDVSDPLAAGLFRPYDEALAHHGGRLRRLIPYQTRQFEVPLPTATVEDIVVRDLFDNILPPETVEGRLRLIVSRLPIYLETNRLSPEGLAAVLRQGRVLGVAPLRVDVDIARTAAGVPGVVADVSSAVPAAMRVTGRLLSVPDTCRVATRSATTLLPGLRKRRLRFPFTQLADTTEGQAGPKLEVRAGGERLSGTIPRLWLAVAEHRRDIVIDGDLREWSDAPGLRIDRQQQATYMPSHWHGPEDGSARLQVAWNEEDLLVAARVTDSTVDPTRRLYGGECIELFLDMDHAAASHSTSPGPHTRQLFLNPPVEGKWPTGEVSALERVEGGRLAAQRTGDGYVLEAAIPLDNLRVAGFVPRPGEVIGFLPTLCDFDEGEGRSKLVWTERESEYLDTSTWGRLALLPPGGLPGHANTAAIVSQWLLDGAAKVPDLGPAGFEGEGVGIRAAGGKEPGAAFDGRTSLVWFADAHWELPAKRFEIRFRPTIPVDRDQLLWCEPTSPGWRYRGILQGDGRLRFELRDYRQQNAFALTTRRGVTHIKGWVDAAYEWDAEGGRIRLYLDDELEAETQATLESATSGLFIGGSPQEGMFYSGLVQKVRIIDLEGATAGEAGHGVCLEYGLDRLIGDVVAPRDVAAPDIKGKCLGPIQVTDGKVGNCFRFNGVDSLVSFPATFCGPQVRLGLWLCPAGDPKQDVKPRFRARLGSARDGILDTWCRASMSDDGKAQWGVMQRGDTFHSRLSAKQYIFAADSPFSGFRMQAWLDPQDRCVAFWYAHPGADGKLLYHQLRSRTQVWRGDLWTHVAVELDQPKQEMRLLVNGTVEATGALYSTVRSPVQSFSLGGSRRDGLPFCGKIDEFVVRAPYPSRAWILPEGGMEYAPQTFGENVVLATPFRPHGFGPQDTATIDASALRAGNASQRIRVSRAEAGIACMVDAPRYRDRYSVGVAVRSSQASTARLLISRADNPEAASFEGALDVADQFRAYEFLDAIRGAGRCYLFVLFDRPGTYWIDDVWVE